jgi:hypothetical protein
VAYRLTIVNTTTTLTLTQGAGVTITGGLTVLGGAEAVYLVTITSPTTVTIQRMYSSITATFTA